VHDKGCKVLVIDDIPEMGELIGFFLSHRRNDRVVFARDGYQGLKAARQDPPHLILLDLMMPGLHGYDVLWQIRKMPALQGVPVVVLSVLSPSEAYAEARRMGAAGYLNKPFSLNELLAARDAVLRGEAFYPPWVESE